MDLDFHAQYQEYSNTELLKIVGRPDDFQPEAVSAATTILQQRAVTDHDREEADGFYKELEESKRLQAEKIGRYKEQVVDVLEPILRPGPGVKIHQWLRLFLVVFSIQFAWTFYHFVQSQIAFLHCSVCWWTLSMKFALASLCYQLIAGFLLFKRSRWGWALLLADNIFTGILQVSDLDLVFGYRIYYHQPAGSFFFSLFINIAFIIFLWKKDVSAYFGVSDGLRKRTAWIAVLLATGYILAGRNIF